MRALSIIGAVFFAILFLFTCSSFAEMMEILEEFETLGDLASLFGAGNDLSNFSDNTYAVGGASMVACIYGFVLSVVGIFASNNNKKAALSVNDELMQLGRLRDSGVLSEDEFEAKKRQLMSR